MIIIEIFFVKHELIQLNFLKDLFAKTVSRKFLKEAILVKALSEDMFGGFSGFAFCQLQYPSINAPQP